MREMKAEKLNLPFADEILPSVSVINDSGGSAAVSLIVKTKGGVFAVSFRDILEYRCMDETYWSAHFLSKVAGIPKSSALLLHDSPWINDFVAGGLCYEHELRHVVILGGDQVVDVLVRQVDNNWIHVESL